MQTFKYKQNDLVNFDLKNGVSGVGEICGVTHIDIAVIGAGYIVRVVHNTGTVEIPNDLYPFNHISVSEVFLDCAQ